MNDIAKLTVIVLLSLLGPSCVGERKENRCPMDVLKPSVEAPDIAFLGKLTEEVRPGISRDDVTSLFGVEPFQDELDGRGDGRVFWRFYIAWNQDTISYHIYLGSFVSGCLEEGSFIPGPLPADAVRAIEKTQ
jgi:hypothetical protein